MPDQQTPPTPPAAPPAAPTTPAAALPPGGQAAPDASRAAAEQQTAEVAKQVLEGTIDLERDGDKVVEVMVDGQPRRYKLRDAAKKISLGEVGYERMEQAAKLRKEAKDQTDALLAALNDLDPDPDRFAASIGVVNRLRQKANLPPIDLRALSEAYLSRQAQVEAMTPEQRRVMELEQQLQQMRQQDVERQRQAEEAQRRAEDEEDRRAAEAAAKKFVADTDRTFGARGLPKSDAMRARAAAHLVGGMEHGIDYHLDDVTAAVEREFVEDTRSYLAAMDGPRLVEALGKETVEKVRQELVRMATSGYRPPAPPPTVGSAPPSNGAPKPQPQRLVYESGDVDTWRRLRGGT